MNFKKIIFIISFLALFGFLFNLNVPKVKAQNTEELLAQIKQLQNQILLLQKQLADIQVVPSEWCHDFNVNLRIGDSGAEVTALQTALSKEGLYTTEVTGTFDEYTASAVVAFQEKYASGILTPWRLAHGTGYVGSTTRTKLNQIYGCTAVVPITPTCQTLWWYNNDHQYCQQSQFCGDFMYAGLYTFKTETECKTSLGEKSATCTDSDGGKSYYVKGTVTDSGKTYTDYCYGAFSVKEYFCLDSSSVGLGGVAEEVYVCPNQQSCKEGICVSTTTPYLIISNVNGIKSTYNPGEKISLTIKGMESDGTVASAGEGFNIQSYIYDTKRTKTYDGVNGAYDSTTGLWNVTLTAPSDLAVVSYDLEIALYCSTEQGSCAQKYGAGPTGGGQVEKWYQFTLAGATQPSITVISPNGGERWVDGQTYTITWKHNLAGNFEAWIDLLKGGTYYGSIAGGDIRLPSAQNLTSYSWQVGNMKGGAGEGSNYQVRITYHDLNTGVMLNDISDNYFSIISSTTTCADSDGGLNFYVKGTVNWVDASGVKRSSTDGCRYDGITLAEVYCGDNPDIAYQYTCPNGCKDGACLQVTTPSIIVISPNGGEQWQIGKTYNITWKASGLTKTSGTTEKVNIELTNDTTGTGWYIAYNVDASLGTYSWTVPLAQTIGSNYKINIWDAGNVSVKDTSDNYFSITGTTNLPDLQIIDINPTSVTQNQITNFTAVVKNNSSQNITIPFVVNLGGITTTISSLAAWQTATVSASFGLSILGSNQVGARADIWNTVAESNESNNDFSKTVNVVAASSITVMSPNGGERWIVGETYSIKWRSEGLDTVTVNLYDPSTSHSYGLASNVIASQGNYTWTIPSTIPGGSTYKIQVSGSYKTLALDESDNYFSIVAATATCTDSDGGKNYNIKGTCTDNVQTYSDNCLLNVVNEWFCENNLCKNEVYTCPNGCENGACKQVTPSITVISPNGGEQIKLHELFDITWKSSGVNNAYIYLWFPDGGTCKITDVSASQGKYSEVIMTNEQCPNIPRTITPGQYKILITTEIEGIKDYSDNYFSIVSAISACTDSDGGLNYNVKGTVTYGSTVNTDTCSASGYLFEQHCLNGNPVQATYWCPKGCQDGACIQAVPPSIISISPTSGTANDTITIYGKNLFGTKPSGIIVEFLENGVLTGSISSPITESSDGSYLKFLLSGTFVGMQGPGTYQVRAINDYGESNTIDFTIILATSAITNIENQLADISKAVSNLIEEMNNLLLR